MSAPRTRRKAQGPVREPVEAETCQATGINPEALSNEIAGLVKNALSANARIWS